MTAGCWQPSGVIGRVKQVFPVLREYEQEAKPSNSDLSIAPGCG